jgi:hypothetical protein
LLALSIFFRFLKGAIQAMGTIAAQGDHAVIVAGAVFRIAGFCKVAIRICTIREAIKIVVLSIVTLLLSTGCFSKAKWVLTVHQTITIVVDEVEAILLRACRLSAYLGATCWLFLCGRASGRVFGFPRGCLRFAVIPFAGGIFAADVTGICRSLRIALVLRASESSQEQ